MTNIENTVDPPTIIKNDETINEDVIGLKKEPDEFVSKILD